MTRFIVDLETPGYSTVPKREGKARSITSTRFSCVNCDTVPTFTSSEGFAEKSAIDGKL